MTAATKTRPAPYFSGFCGLRAPASSHARCPGGYGTDKPCACTCHQTCSACGQKLPAATS